MSDWRKLDPDLSAVFLHYAEQAIRNQEEWVRSITQPIPIKEPLMQAVLITRHGQLLIVLIPEKHRGGAYHVREQTPCGYLDDPGTLCYRRVYYHWRSTCCRKDGRVVFDLFEENEE